MVHNCWEDYLWKVHDAIPMDPWKTELQLLDVLIDQQFNYHAAADEDERRSSPARLLRLLFRRKKKPYSVRRAFASGQLRRVGSMLTLGDDTAASWHDGVLLPIVQGLTALGCSGDIPTTGHDVVLPAANPCLSCGLAVAKAPASLNPSKPGTSTGDAVGRDGAAEEAVNKHDVVAGSANSFKAATAVAAQSSCKPAGAEVDGAVVASAIADSLPNGPTSGKPAATTTAAALNDCGSEGALGVVEGYMSLFKVRMLPATEASVASSTSVLASLGIASSAVSGELDAKNSRTVKCKFSGLRSERVFEDALMRMVGGGAHWLSRRPKSDLPIWTPYISHPLLRWSPTRGRRLWIVTEILYANKIEVENDVKTEAGGSGSVTTNGVEAGKGEGKVGSGKDVMWNVSAETKDMRFPFAFKLMKLDYDAQGQLHLHRDSEGNHQQRQRQHLPRTGSFNMVNLPHGNNLDLKSKSDPADNPNNTAGFAHFRSASISHVIPRKA